MTSNISTGKFIVRQPFWRGGLDLSWTSLERSFAHEVPVLRPPLAEIVRFACATFCADKERFSLTALG